MFHSFPNYRESHLKHRTCRDGPPPPQSSAQPGEPHKWRGEGKGGLPAVPAAIEFWMWACPLEWPAWYRNKRNRKLSDWVGCHPQQAKFFFAAEARWTLTHDSTSKIHGWYSWPQPPGSAGPWPPQYVLATPRRAKRSAHCVPKSLAPASVNTYRQTDISMRVCTLYSYTTKSMYVYQYIYISIYIYIYRYIYIYMYQYILIYININIYVCTSLLHPHVSDLPLDTSMSPTTHPENRPAWWLC